MVAQRKFWIRLSAVILGFSFIFFAPYRSTTSPEWVIQVVDEHGEPVSGLGVAEEWSYFGIDFNPMMENAKTDVLGRATFPRRVIWASLASRLLNPQGASGKLG